MKPTKRGRYWAKGRGYSWNNLICNVEGEPPFLYISRVMNIDTGNVECNSLPSVVSEWGPPVEIPTGKIGTIRDFEGPLGDDE